MNINIKKDFYIIYIYININININIKIKTSILFFRNSPPGTAFVVLLVCSPPPFGRHSPLWATGIVPRK